MMTETAGPIYFDFVIQCSLFSSHDRCVCSSLYFVYPVLPCLLICTYFHMSVVILAHYFTTKLKTHLFFSKNWHDTAKSLILTDFFNGFKLILGQCLIPVLVRFRHLQKISPSFQLCTVETTQSELNSTTPFKHKSNTNKRINTMKIKQ